MSSSAAADLTMKMLLIIAVLSGLVFIMWMGLLRILRELMDTETSEAGTRQRMQSENWHDL
jgi:arginine exporter protein ArgO